MSEEIRRAILTYTSQPAYRPVKPRIIAERLGLEGDAALLARKLIKKLVRAGELEFGPAHLVLPVAADHPARVGSVLVPGGEVLPPTNEGPANERRPKRDERHIVGTLRRIGSGDCFVRPEGTPASAGKDNDVFIPAPASGDASSGDRVRVRLDNKPGRFGKLGGRVIDIVERATNQFVGTYFEKADMGYVQIDGKVFTTPVYVGDPGAKGARTDDKVVVEMVRFPSQLRDGEGVITEILGQRGQPGIDTLGIVYEFGLPGPFSEEVLEDSRLQAEKFDESIPPGRADLTGETVITIDPVDARDFDDAISLTQIERGHWLLGVHIADVSHFVQPGSALDTEAYNRATSVYLPDQVIPMLPEIISNNLASLQPHKVRYAMTCRIEFTPDGAPVAVDVEKSAIRSVRRFTYEEVDNYLLAKGLVTRSPVSPKRDGPAIDAHSSSSGFGETGLHKTKRDGPALDVNSNTSRFGETGLQHAKPDGGEFPVMSPEVDSLLDRMFTLGMILRKRRLAGGALELSMPEMKVDLDGEGRVSGAHLEQNTESHQIIEDFMLAANMAVARKLFEAGLIFLRRVHGAPDPRRMHALTQFVKELGFEAENLENRFELQKLLDSVKGDPREPAVNFAALRSMQRAIYSPEEEGHYALASDCYCHFTSPIRRYPDLTVHRLLDELARGKKPHQEPVKYFQWGDHCSEREQRAASAERELKKIKLLNYFADKIGLELDGVITGVESFGMFVMGREIPVEGLVQLASLTDDYYRFERQSHLITGFRSGNTFRLGDTVRVAVAAVDVDTRTLDFRLISRLGKAPAKPRRTGTRKAGPVKGKPTKPAKKKAP